jgi:nitroreductase
MELYDTIRRRRMVRNYQPDAVERATIERIVGAARSGPSAGFAQGQYLVVVTHEVTRAKIAELADEPLYVAQGMDPWISVAPVHVVVCANEADYHRRYQEPDKLNEDGTEIDWPVPYWFVDAGAAMMLLLLAAVEEGMGAGFFGVHRLDGLKQLLSIPDEVDPIGVVTIGHPAGEQPKGSASRGWRALDDVVRWEHW